MNDFTVTVYAEGDEALEIIPLRAESFNEAAYQVATRYIFDADTTRFEIKEAE
jgi:hypothetical protein